MNKKRDSRSTNICLFLAIGWTILVWYASTMSSSKIPKVNIKIEGLDKVAHVILYSVFAFLWVHVFYKYKIIYPKWIVFGIAVTFGIAMELVQYYFFIDRSFEVPDIIANIIGSFIGVTLLNRIKFFKLC